MSKLSIITINLNNAAGLYNTMKSVLNQTCSDLEYIVVDGGSIDNSINVIREFETYFNINNIDNNEIDNKNLENTEFCYKSINIKKLKWISEPDLGIYNAMNKGIRLSSGDYLQFLNSGDILAAPNVTERMLKDMPECGVLTGDMQIVKNKKLIKWKAPRMAKISFMTLFSGSINHSPSYIKRDLFDKYGYYDESLKITSDWKFFLIAIGLNNEKIVLKNITVTQFDVSGISSLNLDLRNSERRLVLEELVPHSILMDYDEFVNVYNKIQRINENKFLSLMIELIYRVLSKLDKLKYTFK